MTKTTSAFRGILVALAVLALFAFAASAYADTRDSRDRGSTGRTIEPTPTPPPTPSTGSGQAAPTPPPPSPSGGITSTTVGSVDSGGNQGGNVVTGDEHVEVFEVNVGPTNPSPPPPTEEEEEEAAPPVPEEPQCDGRARTGCTPQDTGRTR